MRQPIPTRVISGQRIQSVLIAATRIGGTISMHSQTRQGSWLCSFYRGLATKTWLTTRSVRGSASSNHKEERGPGKHPGKCWSVPAAVLQVEHGCECRAEGSAGGGMRMHQMIAVPALMSTSMKGLRKDGDMLRPSPLLRCLLQCSEVWLDLGKNRQFSGFSKYYIKGKNDIKTRSNCVNIFSSFAEQIPSMSCVLHFLFPRLSFPSAELTSEIRVHNQYVNNQGVCSLHYTDIRGISSTVWWIL